MRIYNPPKEPFIHVLYKDEGLLILEKPSGLLSVPGRSVDHYDSLATRAQSQYTDSLIVHRLDMDTSGLVVMARNPEVHRKLSHFFQNREVEKKYFARVWGVPGNAIGEVNLPLICDWPNRPRQKVDFAEGKPSLTRWEKVSSSENSSLIRLMPVTGRSHQLRVHMQAIGHPILGDPFYAHPDALKGASRLLLHASELKFSHPVSGEALHFNSELPGEFLIE
ncbi:pseudouridine synthase [Microbulbifer sp. EKSA005]|uniref:pseudouridine synthase n=1 Tax=Microbulbifer sp. EKSA005 TaxID=3243364 RepID=UPI004042EE7C